MPDDAFNWIDDELRHVPLPEGLQSRLRRARRLGAGPLGDDALDAALAEVEAPPELLSLLLTIVDDQQLDERLCDIPLPEELLADLQAIPQYEQLRDVPVPVDLLLELRRIPPQRKRRMPTTQLALAASLLLMITLGYAASMAGLMMSAYGQVGEPYTLFVINRPGVELFGEVHPQEALAIEFPAAPPAAAPAAIAVPWHDPHAPSIDSRSIAEQLASAFSDGFTMSDSRALIEFEILGQPHTAEDRTPDLQWLGGIEQRGIEPPIALGFDRQFLITKRTNPIVSFLPIKRLDEGSEREKLLNDLRHHRLPLWSSTGSFDALRRQVLRRQVLRRQVTRRQITVGRLPSQREIHVEDFVAAMDFGYEKPQAGELGIRAFAGPSVFGEDYASLMQVGVQAGMPKSYDRRPTHVTLALDVSDSMQWQSRLETVREAVREFSQLLRAEDRLSLIAFNEQAHVLVEDIAGNDQQSLIQALESLRPDGGTNLLAGLQSAAVAADTPLATQFEDRHVVMISDGMPSLPGQTSDGVAKLLAAMWARNIELHIFAVDGTSDDDIGPSQLGLRQLAALAGQDVARCNSSTQLNEYLCERLLDVSPELAHNAVLTISFNPQSVQAYRLLGHEATTAGGMFSAEVKSTLLAGQAATTLFEVWLEPEGPKEVASVRVDWTDADGRSQYREQDITRTQFKTSWRESALQLQAAVIAAEAAEVLRASHFSPARNGNRDLQDVLQQAEEVNPLLAERASFQQFVEVLRQAEAARRGLPLEN